MSVKNRLKDFIKSTGLSILAWEKSINASNGYVNSIVKGIGEDKIQIILEVYPNLNFDWLMTGRGEMTFSSYIENQNSTSFIVNEEAIPYNEDYWRGRYDQLKEDYNRLFQELQHIKSASAS